MQLKSAALYVAQRQHVLMVAFLSPLTHDPLAEVYAGASGLSYSKGKGFEPLTISESLTSLAIMPTVGLSTTDAHLVLFVSSVLKADRFCEYVVNKTYPVVPLSYQENQSMNVE